jgi:hypothetical protein
MGITIDRPVRRFFADWLWNPRSQITGRNPYLPADIWRKRENSRFATPEELRDSPERWDY